MRGIRRRVIAWRMFFLGAFMVYHRRGRGGSRRYVTCCFTCCRRRTAGWYCSAVVCRVCVVYRCSPTLQKLGCRVEFAIVRHGNHHEAPIQEMLLLSLPLYCLGWDIQQKQS